MARPPRRIPLPGMRDITPYRIQQPSLGYSRAYTPEAMADPNGAYNRMVQANQSALALRASQADPTKPEAAAQPIQRGQDPRTRFMKIRPQGFRHPYMK